MVLPWATAQWSLLENFLQNLHASNQPIREKASPAADVRLRDQCVGHTSSVPVLLLKLFQSPETDSEQVTKITSGFR